MQNNFFPKKLNLNDFDYELPENKIALFPNEKREQSKLLVFESSYKENTVIDGRMQYAPTVGAYCIRPSRNDSKITHSSFDKICDFIPENSLVILNSTKVIPARFAMKKESGGVVELLLTEPIFPSQDPQITISSNSPTVWECIVGGRKILENTILTPIGHMQCATTSPQFNDSRGKVCSPIENNTEWQANPAPTRNAGVLNLKAFIKKRYENKATVEFSWQPENFSFAEVLELLGKIPLPPYIKREVSEIDKNRYQTVYAKIAGSVAAPTAGLHFSENIFSDFKNKNIEIAEVVLNVGPGTFVPIETEINFHQMHSEQIFVSKKTIEMLSENYLKEKSFTVATGTTSLRTLETLYWFGVRLLREDFDVENFDNSSGFFLEQNYPYLTKMDFTVEETFSILVDFLNKKNIDLLHLRTQLFIVPSYKIRTANALITNFHLPKSTLLLLVSAFVGTENCKNIYSSALENNYKFLSYGDSSLLKI